MGACRRPARSVDAGPPAPTPPAGLVAPDGAGGETFLVFGNFAAIRRYNPSDYYAIAVGLIGDQVTDVTEAGPAQPLRAQFALWQNSHVRVPWHAEVSRADPGPAGNRLRPDPPSPTRIMCWASPIRSVRSGSTPRESFDLDETGIAAVAKTGAPRLTSDGEVFDQTALAAGHATIQLPAIARLTDLEKRSPNPRAPERSRLRGSAPAGRGHRPRRVPAGYAAQWGRPGAPAGAAERKPRRRRGAARCAIPGDDRRPAWWRRGRGTGPAARRPPRQRASATRPGGRGFPTRRRPPRRRCGCPKLLLRPRPQPGKLIVRLDMFDEYQYAAIQRAKMGGTNAAIVTVFEGRTQRFRVEVGPLPDIARR